MGGRTIYGSNRGTVAGLQAEGRGKSFADCVRLDQSVFQEIGNGKDRGISGRVYMELAAEGTKNGWPLLGLNAEKNRGRPPNMIGLVHKTR